MLAFLKDHAPDFRNDVIEDCGNDYSSRNVVKDVMRDFKNVFRWAEKVQDHFLNTQDDSDSKAKAMNALLDYIDLFWYSWLLNNYEPLKEECKNIPRKPAVKKQQVIQEAEEKKRAEYQESIFNDIIGTTEKKNRIFDVLKTALNGKGGKQAATVLEAAMELGWLSKRPKFPAMKLLWGVIGSSQAVSKCFEGDMCNLPEKDINARKTELMEIMEKT